jgi:hypothetical protein
MIDDVIRTQARGGRTALNREARKLEKGRGASPASAPDKTS